MGQPEGTSTKVPVEDTLTKFTDAPLHVMEDVDTAEHPSGIDLINIRCDCNRKTGWDIIERAHDTFTRHSERERAREAQRDELGL